MALEPDKHLLPPVTALDIDGKTHQFVMSAGALRKIVKGSAALARNLRDPNSPEYVGEGSDADTLTKVETMFLTIWLCRVDKSETDQEVYFAKFSSATIKQICTDLDEKHAAKADPTQPATPPAIPAP